MSAAQQNWRQRNRSWLYDVESSEFKQRQSFALWVYGPMALAAMVFVLLSGADKPLAYLAALPFAALGWLGLKARLRHKQRRL